MTFACHQCGQPLPDNAPGGELCSACLWQLLHGAEETRVAAEAAEVTAASSQFPKVPGHEIVEELAHGGMGVVYRARQFEPNREVALKMLLPLGSGREDLRERFRVEVRALAELDHPGILPLYQVGETRDRPWFTMKLAAGGSLATRLKMKRAPADPTAAATLIAGLADAVHYAHEHGVLHRDIKPGNILFDERSTPFLADFGLAKLSGSTTDMTRTAAVMGTPCYMAPEVASNGAKAATVLSDIYGLGAVLYELLAGRPPFVVDGMAALLKKIIEDEPERPSTLADHVPRDLELICLTCMAKDPRRRYASAAAVADDLRRWMRGEPIAARRTGTVTRLWAWTRRRPALAATSVALIVTLTGGSAWLAVTRYDLSRTLESEREARASTDSQSEFLIGEFADSLERIGRLELIEQACKKADENNRPIDDSGHLRRARLLCRWASASWARGDGKSAAARLNGALLALDSLEHPDAGSFELRTLARCRLAEVLADTVSFHEALNQLDSAESDLTAPGKLDFDATLGLKAEADRTRAMIWNRLKRDAPEAAEAAARAVTSYRAWQAEKRLDRDRILALARALREAGKSWYNSGGEHPDPADLEKALPLFKEASGMMRALENRTPAEDFELAYCSGWAGDCMLHMEGQGIAAAKPFLEEELQIVTALTIQDSLNGHWQLKLANCYSSLAQLAKASGDKPARARAEERRLKILHDLHKRAPAVREWSLAWSSANLHAGKRAVAAGDKLAAADFFKLAFDAATAWVIAQPASHTEQDGWYDVCRSIGAAWITEEEVERADAFYREAISIATREAATSPAALWWQWTLAGLQRRVADVALKKGDAAAVIAANVASLETRAFQLRSRTPGALNNPAAVAHSFEELEKAQVKNGDITGALRTASSALQTFVECRELAGPLRAWANPVKHVIEAARAAGGEYTEEARQLATAAAAGFFPPSGRVSLTEKERDLLLALEALASPS